MVKKMKMRFGLALVAALGLTACAERDVMMNTNTATNFGSFQEATMMAATEADSSKWDKASEVTITLQRKEFAPMMLHLKQNQPYILKVVNNSNSPMSFKANEFFQTTLVRSLSEVITDEAVYPPAENPLMVSFIVPAMSERTINVVPAVKGRFEYEDATPGIMIAGFHWAPWGYGKTQGSFGMISVD